MSSPSFSPIRVFASHDWGKDGTNHERVMKLCKILHGREGIHVWYDEKDMKNDILTSMCKGIDQCDVVLVFITENYIRKVAEGGEADNVRREFMYSVLKKKVMIPIRMENVPCDRWTGPVGMQLGSTLYMDYPSDLKEGENSEFISSVRNRISSSSSRTLLLRAGRKASLQNVVANEMVRATHRPPPPLPRSSSLEKEESAVSLERKGRRVDGEQDVQRKGGCAVPTLKERLLLAQKFVGHKNGDSSTSDQLDKLLLSVVGERGAKRMESLPFVEKLEEVERNIY